MSKKEDRIRSCEKLRDQPIKEKSVNCKTCPYYQRRFKYRICLFARCPYDMEKNVFRKHPLKYDTVI